MNIIIRQEQADDYLRTEKVIETAFANAVHSDKNEHKLVSRIRKSNTFVPQLSLVAIDKHDGSIVGHILLSKIKILNAGESTESLALAPVSVLPDYQNKGIGKRLIVKALEQAKRLGFHSVIVLGHPEYYPKFGFQKASEWEIKAPFDVPDEAFMAIELQDNAFQGVAGIVEYPSVFF